MVAMPGFNVNGVLKKNKTRTSSGIKRYNIYNPDVSPVKASSVGKFYNNIKASFIHVVLIRIVAYVINMVSE